MPAPRVTLCTNYHFFCLLAGVLKAASSLQQFNYVQHTAKEHGKLRWAARINAIHSARSPSQSECVWPCMNLWGLFM